MCGRYALHGPHGRRREALGDEVARSLVDRFIDDLVRHTRYNIAPGSDVPVIAVRDGEPELRLVRWGLKQDGKPFNIRSDSAPKPWARSLLRSRVVFPASGFYEWQAQGRGPKQPWYFRDPEGRYLAIAGVVGHWEGLGAAMFTCDANDVMRPVHDRMPVVLDEAGAAAWLDPATRFDDMLALLHPAAPLVRYCVGRAVGNSRNEGPGLVEPIYEDSTEGPGGGG
jgi:putative SOS response-associated peptidase YedK